MTSGFQVLKRSENGLNRNWNKVSKIIFPINNNLVLSDSGKHTLKLCAVCFEVTLLWWMTLALPLQTVGVTQQPIGKACLDHVTGFEPISELKIKFKKRKCTFLLFLTGSLFREILLLSWPSPRFLTVWQFLLVWYLFMHCGVEILNSSEWQTQQQESCHPAKWCIKFAKNYKTFFPKKNIIIYFPTARYRIERIHQILNRNLLIFCLIQT